MKFFIITNFQSLGDKGVMVSFTFSGPFYKTYMHGMSLGWTHTPTIHCTAEITPRNRDFQKIYPIPNPKLLLNLSLLMNLILMIFYSTQCIYCTVIEYGNYIVSTLCSWFQVRVLVVESAEGDTV